MKQCRIFLLYILWLTGLLLTPAVASPSYYFKQLSLNEGLSQSTVKCVINDHKGLIWIGTRFGLNCFDREQMKSYYYNEQIPNSIPGSNIEFITEDEQHNLWVGTTRGLALYNRESDTFTTQQCADKRVEVYTSTSCRSGMLFFGRNRFYHYEYATRRLKALPIIKKEGVVIPPTKAHTFDYERGIILLTCRWEGAWWYHLESGKVEAVPFIADREIAASYIDSERNLWISVYGKGLFCYTPQGELLHHLSTDNHLTNNWVLDITEKEGEIWIATDGGGICIYNLAQKSTRAIAHHPGDPDSCPVNSFYCLYKDSEKNMWAGSIRGGLIGIKEVYMKTYKEATFGATHGLSNRSVVGLYEDSDGILWLGTDGAGVNRFDPATNRFRHYPSTAHSKVVSIIGYSKEELLISCFGESAYYFNKQTGALRELPIKDREKHKMMFGIGKSVLFSPIDKEHICLLADSVYLYNLTTHTLEAAQVSDPNLLTSSLQPISSHEYVSYLYGESAILELNHKLRTLQVVYRLNDPFEIITAVSRDRNGNFWIATTNSIFCYNAFSEEIKQVSSTHFTGVSAICFDTADRMWIGTHNALYAYLLQTERSILFGESDGVSANEYILKTPLISTSGDIYMAGAMGLLRISGKTVFPENPDPKITLLHATLDGAPLLKEDTSAELSLPIPWDHTSLSFQVIVHENDLMRKKLFRYYLHGEREEMVESYGHAITYHSLPVGEYEVLVSCNKKNGDWSKPIPLARFQVLPPWWKTTTFFLLAGIGIALALTATLLLLLKRKERKMRWAMKEHEQKSYEEKVRFLINISHELRTPLTLIYAPLKRILGSGEVADEGLSAQLSNIFKQTRRIKNLINMVLDVRKMEEGGEVLHLQTQELNGWIRSVADDFASECSAHQIALVYELDPAIPPISFDPQKCEVILSNLLMNALKFSHPNSTITLSTHLQGEMVRIAIADQGIGLKGADKTHLFRRFYQGEHTVPGSGIGLSYSRLLVEMHGGTIGADDNVGEGATFYIDLPHQCKAGSIVARPYLNEMVSPSPTETLPETTLYEMKRYTILLVEDEEELRKYLKESLSPYFKNVLTANDGLEALELTARWLPDLVVSDVMMPRMDGFELCRQIKSNLEVSHIPVVLLTARTDMESSRQGYKLGADVYLPKPFDMDFLHTVIGSLLQNRDAIKLRYRNSLSVVAPKEETISHADEKFMQKLNELIRTHMADPTLDVTFVAEQMAMSRATLYNKMKALTDVSIGDYIQKFRMTYAAELLMNKDLSILEISEKVGFSSQRYFSTAFRQLHGTTPTKYRQDREGAKED